MINMPIIYKFLEDQLITMKAQVDNYSEPPLDYNQD